MPKVAKTGRAIRLGILELVLLMLGLLFVRREIWEFHATTLTIEHWQVGLLIPLAAADGAMTGAYSSRTRNVEHLPAYSRTMLWGLPTFFFLYVACAALCERISVGVFTIIPEVMRCFGLLIVAAGLGLRVWTQSSMKASLAAPPSGRLSTAQSKEQVPSEKPEESRLEGGAPGEDKEESRLQSDGPTLEAGSPTDKNDEPRLQAGAPIPEADAPATETDDPTKVTDTPSTVTDDRTNVTNDPSEVPCEETDISRLQASGPNPETIVTTNEPMELFSEGPHKWVRYPDALGKLVSLTGLPLVFNAWMPLLVLPGVFILLKWHINDRESFRISQLGQPYLDYKKRTKNLLPFIY